MDRLNRVISELLEFSRATDLRRQPSEVGPLVSRSLQLVQQDAANKNISIDLDLESDICLAWIDPDRLTQCLLNLYLNAIQAMDRGGILKVHCIKAESRTFDITVSDNGKGISPDRIKRIFDPYYTTKSKGTGLGLAIVNKIIEAHGGRVKVSSREGQGTSFTLRLPCESKEPVKGEIGNA